MAPRGLAGIPFAHERTFERGEFLVRAEWRADAAFLLESGQVRCFLLDPHGRETTTAVLGRGQLVGLAPFVGHATHHDFAQALTKVEAWALPAKDIRRALPTSPALQGLALGCLAQRMELGLALLRGVALLPVADRVRDIQVRLALAWGTHQVRVKRSTLAGLLQIRPETLARTQPLPAATLTNSHPPAMLPKATALPHMLGGHIGRRAFGIDDVALDGELPVGCIGLVASGEVRLFLPGNATRGILVETLGSGDFFGIGGLLGLPPVAMRLVGVSAGTIEVWRASDFLELLAQTPDACGELLARFAQRLEMLERGLVRAALPDVRQRLMHVIREVAVSEGVPDRNGARLIPPTWSQVALAGRIGVCRETVTRGLAALAEAGAIRRKGRRIVLLDDADAEPAQTMNVVRGKDRRYLFAALRCLRAVDATAERDLVESVRRELDRLSAPAGRR